MRASVEEVVDELEERTLELIRAARSGDAEQIRIAIDLRGQAVNRMQPFFEGAPPPALRRRHRETIARLAEEAREALSDTRGAARAELERSHELHAASNYAVNSNAPTCLDFSG